MKKNLLTKAMFSDMEGSAFGDLLTESLMREEETDKIREWLDMTSEDNLSDIKLALVNYNYSNYDLAKWIVEGNHTSELIRDNLLPEEGQA
jgi:hypothetical protein